MTTATPTPPKADDGTRAIRMKLRASNRRGRRGRLEAVFKTIAVSAAVASVLLLAALLGSIFYQGIGRLNWAFLTGVPDPEPSRAGLWPAIIGTLCTCLICALTAIPIGVGTAILLEEFRPKNPRARRVLDFVQLNITNLAGVPSIVYGLLGLTAFASMFGLFGTQLSPAWELGARHYDQFVTPANVPILVPVASADAPPTPAREAAAFFDANEQPTEVSLIDGLAQRRSAVQEKFETIARDLAAAFEQTPGPAALDAVATAWAAAGLQSDFATVRPDIAARLGELDGKTGRAARKAAERALTPALDAEIAAIFGNSIDPDAVPNRITRGRDAPWYLRVPFGRSVLAGGLTLMLVILPVIIIASQEALRAVPPSLRQASLAMGATTWQTVWRVTLPSSVPGIMTGVILAMSRAIGEAAPILVLAGIVYITFTPGNLMDDFTVMPLQIYNWAGRPQKEFYEIAAAGIILLLVILLAFNGLAVYIRQKTQRQG
jgi:phosphate transport system permease protein